MIERYTDHAANERTFLAWIRTALAMVAIGGMLAKFDIFLRLLEVEGHGGRHIDIGSTAWIGAVTILAGLALLPMSWIRFYRVQHALRDSEVKPIPLAQLECWFAGIVFVIGLAVLATLTHAMLP